MQFLSTQDINFQEKLSQLTAWEEVSDQSVFESVSHIIQQIRHQGDEALVALSCQFDGLNITEANQLEIPLEDAKSAFEALSSNQQDALHIAAKRIRNYAEHQKIAEFGFHDEYNNFLGQKVTPLDRAGLYVPGGKAAYPSSVLMNAIPAKVAGVGELIMVTPTPKGERNPLVLAAAYVAGVDRIFTIGGAQAVAALAYGTQTIPMVDKIVGPGNTWVATAKRLVFGQVGIDMIAGPSEILIICDGKTSPDWIAMDLFSQAEHDELAQAILLSDDPIFLEKVSNSIKTLIEAQPRKDIIEKSLMDRGALILVQDLAEACQIANFIAPEHLELSVENAKELLPFIKHAGAVFMGRYTAEALGDYCAGPNHVLPTSRTARFSSPLGVYDFQKRTSLNECSAEGASALAHTAGILADGEGLFAHAGSARMRIIR